MQGGRVTASGLTGTVLKTFFRTVYGLRVHASSHRIAFRQLYAAGCCACYGMLACAAAEVRCGALSKLLRKYRLVCLMGRHHTTEVERPGVTPLPRQSSGTPKHWNTHHQSSGSMAEAHAHAKHAVLRV